MSKSSEATKEKEKIQSADVDTPDIKATFDYNAFNLNQDNRPINRRHVNRLKRSFQEHPELLPHQPGLIGNNKDVIDGQHTLQALIEIEKERGEPLAPFFYTENEEIGIDLASPLNATRKNWSLSTFLAHYASRGIEPYEKLESYVETYPMPVYNALSLMFCGHTKAGGDRTQQFRSGLMEANHEEYAKTIGEELLTLREDHNFNDAFSQSFIIAYVKVREASRDDRFDKFDFDEFEDQLNKSSRDLQKRPNKRQYLKDIEDIYNYNKQNLRRFF